MTDKEREIEIKKIARDICSDYHISKCEDCVMVDCCRVGIIAQELCDKNYRKVPDGAVVLTKEEYDKYLRQGAMIDFLKDCVKQARKETVKAIYITGKYYYAKHSPTERQLSDFLAHIKETYSVEVGK